MRQVIIAVVVSAGVVAGGAGLYVMKQTHTHQGVVAELANQLSLSERAVDACRRFSTDLEQKLSTAQQRLPDCDPLDEWRRAAQQQRDSATQSEQKYQDVRIKLTEREHELAVLHEQLADWARMQGDVAQWQAQVDRQTAAQERLLEENQARQRQIEALNRQLASLQEKYQATETQYFQFRQSNLEVLQIQEANQQMLDQKLRQLTDVNNELVDENEQLNAKITTMRLVQQKPPTPDPENSTPSAKLVASPAADSKTEHAAAIGAGVQIDKSTVLAVADTPARQMDVEMLDTTILNTMLPVPAQQSVQAVAPASDNKSSATTLPAGSPDFVPETDGATQSQGSQQALARQPAAESPKKVVIMSQGIAEAPQTTLAPTQPVVVPRPRSGIAETPADRAAMDLIVRLQTENSRLESDVEQFRMQSEAAAAQAERLAARLTTCRADVAEQDQALARWQTVSRQLAQEQAEFEKQMVVGQKMIAELQQSRQLAESEKEQAGQRLQQLDDTMRQAQAERDAAQQLAETLIAQNQGRSRMIDALRQDLQHARRPAESSGSRNQSVEATYDSLVKALEPEIDWRQATVSQNQKQLTLNFGGRILFDFGRVDITAEGRDILKRVGDILNQMDMGRLRIIGHADNRRIRHTARHKYPSNWELSAGRAAAVVAFFQQQCDIDPQLMEVVGHSFYHPVADNRHEAGRALNRRVEIIVAPPDVANMLQQPETAATAAHTPGP